MHRGVVAVFLAAGLLGACGGNSPSSGTEPASTEGGGSTASTETTEAPVFTNPPTTTNPELVPVAGGSLIVSIEGDSPGFRPYADPWANGGHNVAKAVFDSLATYDSSGKVVPYLAESIAANDDATVWTIVLRGGVTFHNGEPFNADAVRQNLQASKDSPAFGSQLKLLDSMTVVDRPRRRARSHRHRPVHLRRVGSRRSPDRRSQRVVLAAPGVPRRGRVQADPRQHVAQGGLRRGRHRRVLHGFVERDHRLPGDAGER
jgi:hypothetical protein